MPIDPQSYFNDLVQVFPLLAQTIAAEDDDMTFIRMERFASYTIEQIKTKNNHELMRCFNFQEERINYLNPLLKNAVMVSYIESLMLGGITTQMRKVLSLMPPNLKREYLHFQDWYNNLGSEEMRS